MGPFDEYEQNYEELQNSGFEFVYNNHRLGRSKLISKKDICRIPSNKYNSDQMFVRCRPCDIYMDFVTGVSGVLSGYWVCPGCGVKVRERTAYTQLDKENTAFLNDWDLDE